MSRASLSVCMIVKNESRVITRCLENLEGLYDELVVVDTGSSDNTVELVQSFTDKVFHCSECNDDKGNIVDFSVARNHALKAATCDWVLQIDADEIIVEGREHILACITSDTSDRFNVQLLNKDNNPGVLSGRLYKRSRARLYVSRVHEYLEFAGKWETCSSIVIKNMEDKQGKESGSQRNIRLCEMGLAEDENDSRLWYYLGVEYFFLKKYDKAVGCFEKAMDTGRFSMAKYQIMYFSGVCYFMLKNWQQTIKCASLCAQLKPSFAEPYCLSGDVFFALKMFEKARACYQQAIQCEVDPDYSFGVQHWAYEEYPKSQLAKIPA